jgi:hypothetical protein
VSLYEPGNPLSPDGKLVAANDPEGKLTVYPVAGGSPQRVAGVEREKHVIRWAADSRSLYVFQHGRVPADVYRLDVRSGKRELWRTLMPSDPAGVLHVCPVVMTPDATAYAYTYGRFLSDLYVVTGAK